METRLANTWRQTVNEKKFIETALASDLRVDGRNPLEFRKITIKFGREYGTSEVQLGQTHVMGFVTGQLVEPYRDRPNEGSLSIFTEFSPMADPSFEAGRPGESAVELGRIIDRGLRESRAVDMESLCVLAGKLVWAIRIDLHILDNGGNLVDAANIAALAALLTFRRPECTLGEENGQVTVHPPETVEPLPLIVHHLPIAVTFAFFGTQHVMVVDPTHNEEAVMRGRMTVTVNVNGDICSIQKAGGVGIMQSDIMRCLRLAVRNAESITKKIKDAAEAYKTEKALCKIKRHATSVAAKVSIIGGDVEEQDKYVGEKGEKELSTKEMEKLKLVSDNNNISQSNNVDGCKSSSEKGGDICGVDDAKNFLGGPSSWDPYSKGVDSDLLKASLASRGPPTCNMKQKGGEKGTDTEQENPPEKVKLVTSGADSSVTSMQTSGEKTLKDAVKPKNRRRKRASSNLNTS
ncbi:hypothetical protein K2173_016302 [Erythroxylum novogranatense]|uniref:Protein ECERIFERUM 7 n=1 Tax=Erythroxylum novogranatense TaxID=1862640 RepID=A0AAV8SFU5_9ROSI|nr:hypothetical protein K2173_016302 [Erythroxylum novogranatense]